MNASGFSPFRDSRRPGPYIRSMSTTESVIVPHGELSPEALRGVIESFVLREGTEYGERDYSLDEKVRHVTRQLERRRRSCSTPARKASTSCRYQESRRSPPRNTRSRQPGTLQSASGQ
jgi:uncharacterized protein YheU (UPF0270 family)